MNPNQEHFFQYNLALLSAGSATVSVQQFVGNTYQTLATANANSASGSYTFAFTPTSSNIRILVSSNTRFALNNLYLDRDHVDTLVETYALYAGGYRYGFNGMEKDDEIKGEGNSIDFGARLYESRLGRWLSLDPLMAKYPSHSPYNFALNNPIYYKDPDGRDVIPTKQFVENNQLNSVFKSFSTTDVFKQLTAIFVDNHGMNNLLVHYRSNDYFGRSPEIAGINFGSYDAQQIKFATMLIFSGLATFTLNTTGDIVPAEYTYSSTMIAGTLAHELIHANITSYQQNVDAGGIEKLFPGFSAYEKKFGSTEMADHEYMAANSRGMIADAMKQFDVANSINRDDKWYKAAAWAGLRYSSDENGSMRETEAWSKFKSTASQEELDYIETVLSSPEMVGQAKEKNDE